jgi:CubicO group peptidase (beta-lactamase class C family)
MKRTPEVLVLLVALCSACGSDSKEGDATSGTAGPGEGNAPDTAPVLETTPKPATATPLARSTPEAEGVSSQGILELVNRLEMNVHEVHSLMLLRHGKVIAEGWWSPYTPGDMHNMYSVTKSFNSTAVGMAVDAGLLSVDDLVTSFFPDYAPLATAPAFQTMTVKHLLTMHTGHAGDTIDRMRTAPDGQWAKAFFQLPVENEPGSVFVYNSGAAYVLGAIVQKVTGMSVEEYLTPRLFEPLGMVNRLWGSSPEGINMTDGGLSITTEELATFGQLYLQKGQWNGQAIVSEQWATDATVKEVESNPGSGNWNFGYGYQFWRSQIGYRADGSLGQYSFVLPDQDVVLAITAGTSNDGGTNRLMNEVFTWLPPAIGTDALPEDAAAHDALTARLGSLALGVPQGAASSPLAAEVSGKRYEVAPNPQGITAVQLDWSETDPVLTIQDADGPHAIPVGVGQWLRARTGFKKHINELFDTPEQAVSTLGAWTGNSTLDVKLAFTETPYIMDAVFSFNGDELAVAMSYNIRWGSLTEAPLTGTRAATPAPGSLY